MDFTSFCNKHTLQIESLLELEKTVEVHLYPEPSASQFRIEIFKWTPRALGSAYYPRVYHLTHGVWTHQPEVEKMLLSLLTPAELSTVQGAIEATALYLMKEHCPAVPT